MHINKECQDVVLRTILGDGYLYPKGVLQVEHKSKDHQYVLWKHGPPKRNNQEGGRWFLYAPFCLLKPKVLKG